MPCPTEFMTCMNVFPVCQRRGKASGADQGVPDFMGDRRHHLADDGHFLRDLHLLAQLNLLGEIQPGHDHSANGAVRGMIRIRSDKVMTDRSIRHGLAILFRVLFIGRQRLFEKALSVFP